MTQTTWLEAYVLHRRGYRETSYLMDFFTREHGKLSVVAKGVRNSKSDRKSLLQPFQPLRIQVRGKTDLKNLTLVESSARALTLSGDVLFCGMYINELTNRIMPAGLESEQMYQAYTQALTDLSSLTDVEMVLRRFEFALLAEMGLMPDWGVDARKTAAVQPLRWYNYAQDEGMVETAHRESHSVQGEALLMLAEDQWNAMSRQAAKRLSRQILAPLLGQKPLKSRDLFTSLKRNKAR